MSNYYKRTAYLIGIPVLFALVMRFAFGLNSLSGLYMVMSISFLLLVPFGMGALTIYLSSAEKVKSLAYRLFTPWIPIFLFFVITLCFGIEGWACWLMVLPLFLIAASIGGYVAGNFKLKRNKHERTYISLLAILPFFVSPAEQMIGSLPGRYEAYTYIDINASKANIWNNVTRVRGISKEQDKGWLTRFLGFPRPIRAELNYNGVGAYRKAIFEKGLVFHEQVLSYQDQCKMEFSIKAHPYEIPSTTMDKHA